MSSKEYIICGVGLCNKVQFTTMYVNDSFECTFNDKQVYDILQSKFDLDDEYILTTFHDESCATEYKKYLWLAPYLDYAFRHNGNNEPLKLYNDLGSEEYEEYKRFLKNDEERKIFEDIVAMKNDAMTTDNKYHDPDDRYNNSGPRIQDIQTIYHNIKKDILVELENKLKKYAIDKFFSFSYDWVMEGTYISFFDNRIYKISSEKLHENFLECSDFYSIDDKCCNAGIVILEKPKNMKDLKKTLNYIINY